MRMVLVLMVMTMLLGAISDAQEPLFEDQLLMQGGEHPFAGPRGMDGDIIELNDGTLLLTYTRRSRWALPGQATGIWARTSQDQGRTWSEESSYLLDPGYPSEKEHYTAPGFLRFPNGDLLMSYIYNVRVDPAYGHTYYRRSNDDGQTWSEPFILTPHHERTLVLNDKLLLLSSGRILAPAEFSPGAEAGSHRNYVATCFYSDTNGYAWRMSNNTVAADYEVQEPHVVELKDGRIMMMFRTYSGFCGRAYSEDQGETWSEPEALHDLKMTPRASPITVDRIPTTGDLLLLRCTGLGQGERGRTPFVSAISTDEGETWINERVIAGGLENDCGYPSVDFLGDVAVIAYHQRDGLHIARIGIDWFYQQD